MNLLRSLRKPEERASSYTLETFLAMKGLVNPYGTGSFYPQTTYPVSRIEAPETDFCSYVNSVYKRDGVVFAVCATRELLLSETRFKYRTLADKRLFGDPSLQPLEKPWPKGTTGDLLRRMEQDGTLAGNAYIVLDRGGRRLRRLNPGRVAILLSSATDPEDPEFQYDAEIAGYLYVARTGYTPQVFLADEVAHWTPVPDPDAHFRGMSWLTPVIREITSDMAVNQHKQAFFENAATPNLVIKFPDSLTDPDLFERIVNKMEDEHAGAANAYRSLYLMAGADAHVVGASAIDFKQIQGTYETRICMAGRVPAAIVGASEGLQGSSLNSGNFGQARRQLADGWYHPTIKDACSVLDIAVRVPAGSELWYDTSDIPFLREDQLDQANIMQAQMQAARTGIDGGWEPDAVIEAVTAMDLTKLTGRHSGMLSVQLQPPGADTPDEGDAPQEPPAA